MGDEEAILFQFGTVFQVSEVNYDNQLKIWIIHMTPVEHAHENIEKFFKIKDDEIKSYILHVVKYSLIE